MEASFLKSSVTNVLFGAPAYLLAGALCVVGLMETASELSNQDMWFLYVTLAVLGLAAVTWIMSAAKPIVCKANTPKFNVKRVTSSTIDIAVLAMFAWYAVTYFVNGSIAVSRLCEACMLLIAYVSLRVLLSSHRNLSKWLFIMLCVCGLVEAVTGLRQAFGAEHSNHSLFRVTGTFFNPGPYSGYLAVLLSLALGYVVSKYGYAQKIFNQFKNIGSARGILWAVTFLSAICTVIVIIMILPSTMSRAAFVSVGAVLVAITLSNRNVREPVISCMRRHKRRSAVIGLVAAMAICGGAYGVYMLKKDSADGRLLMWKMGVKAMIENPITGVGQGHYRGTYGDVQAEYFSSGGRSETEVNVAGSPEYGFNEYLQIGAETGVPGLVLFLFLLTAALWRLFKARNLFAYGVVAFAVFAFFSYPFSMPPMRMLFVAMLAVAGSLPRKRRETTMTKRITMGVVLAGCIVMAGCLTKPYIERIEATEKWQELRHWYSMDMHSYIVEDYPALYPLMRDNPTFMFEYGRSLNQEGRYAESLDVLIPAMRLSCDPMFYNVAGNNYKSLGDYERAAEMYLKAYYVVPSRMYPLYLLAKMYAENGDRDKATHYARRVVAMTPKIASSATRDMQRDMEEIFDKSD